MKFWLFYSNFIVAAVASIIPISLFMLGREKFFYYAAAFAVMLNFESLGKMIYH